MQIRIIKSTAGNEILSCLDAGGESLVDLSKIPNGLNPEDEMNTFALHLIMMMRQSAVDHECQLPDHNGEHFHGAALVKTSEGRYYLAPNMQTSDDNTDRNCAERGSLNQSKENRAEGEKVTDLWFTGGLGNFTAGVEISPDQGGRRPTPCCACLAALYRDNPNMRVHILPLLLPEKGLSLTAYSGSGAIRPTDVLNLNLRDLYRPDPVIVSNLPDKIALAHVMPFLISQRDVHADKRRLHGVFGRVASHVREGNGLKDINEILMLKLRRLVQLPENHLRYAEVALVTTAEGKIYTGTAIVNGHTPSTPPGISKAIHEATNDRVNAGITAAYYMHVEIAKLKALAASADPGAFEDLIFTLPGGSALERLRKGSVDYRNRESSMTGARGLPIHVIIPNTIEDFDPSLHVHTRYMNDIVARPYAGSKLIMGARSLQVAHVTDPTAPVPQTS